MSTVLGSLSEIAAALFQSLRLSYIVPSFLFWGLNAIFILPILPSEVRELLQQIARTFALQKAALVMVVSLLTGYFLYVLNVPLIRWFEGYHWFEWPLLKTVAEEKRNWHQQYRLKLVRKFEKQVELRKQKIFRWKDEEALYSQTDPNRRPISRKISQLETELEVFRATKAKNIQYLYPTSRESFLPTRLGNVIASFEDYSHDHYEMDAVTLWPRLIPILSQQKYSLFLEREKANLDFLLNACAALLLFSLELIVCGSLYAQDIWPWLSAAGLTIVVSYVLFYRTSIVGALGWGQTVRVAFDLYRYDLLAALCGHSPKNFGEEKKIWRNISDFFRKSGAEAFEPKLDYRKVKEVVAQMPLMVKGENK